MINDNTTEEQGVLHELQDEFSQPERGELQKQDNMPLARPTTPAARRKWDMAVNRFETAPIPDATEGHNPFREGRKRLA